MAWHGSHKSNNRDGINMSNGLPPIVPPDISALLALHKQDVFSSLNCHQLGTIKEFDAQTQTASISINFQRAVFNQQVPTNQLSNQPTPTRPNIVDYPVLVQCPIFVLTGGGSYLTMPIKQGDTCLVLFNDRDIDSWFLSGAVAPPASNRMHSLSDGMAIVGFRSLANVLNNYSNNVVLHSDSLIRISNEATTLKIALNAICSALTGWVNTGGSTPNGATISAINSARAQIDSLLA
jgi:hypothetical protein